MTAATEGWSCWPAPAKINRFLHIVGRREDGYHLLQTVFQLLDWGDDIHLRTREDGGIRRIDGASDNRKSVRVGKECMSPRFVEGRGKNVTRCGEESPARFVLPDR